MKKTFETSKDSIEKRIDDKLNLSNDNNIELDEGKEMWKHLFFLKSNFKIFYSRFYKITLFYFLKLSTTIYVNQIN